MTLTLVQVLAPRRLRSLPRALIVSCFFAMELLYLVLRGESVPLDGHLAGLAAFVFGAGLLGQEWREGSLAVLLCRPISRSGLVLSGWLGAFLSGMAAWSIATMLPLLLALLPSVDFAWSLRSVGAELASALCAAAGMAAVAVAFGAACRGMTGVAFQLVLVMAATSLMGWSQETGRVHVAAAAKEGVRFLLPVPNLSSLLAPQGWSWYEALTWASNVTLLLTLACWILGRAQLAYSSGD